MHHAQHTASELAYGTSHDGELAAVQGYAMFALLPALEKLPMAALDQHRAQLIGGPRLLVAVRAVRAKRAGVDLHHLAATTPEIADLPADQITELEAYYQP